MKFASDGYEVFGVEKNPKLFLLAKNNARNFKNKSSIKVINDDIRNFKTRIKFDAVVFNYVLMFMSKSDAITIIERFYNKLNDRGEMQIKILMMDDLMAIESKDKKDVFFPSYEEMEKICKKYKGRLVFKLIRDKSHDKYKFPHIHSVGILNILK